MSNKNFDMPDKMRNIEFQVDTVSNENYTTLGYAIPNDNMVYLRHNTENPYVNSAVASPAVIQHEQKHIDNASKGMYSYALSKEQTYKINMWDEISANIAALIALRDEYLKNGDINIFDAEAEKFSFYKEAIIQGKIDPHSPYQEDFDKEMSLIINGTKDMWCERYGDMYSDISYSHAISTYDWSGHKKEHYDENYLRARAIACNIGGVDFTKYLKKDVEIPQKGKDKLATYTETKTFKNIANNDSISERLKQRSKYFRDYIYSSIGISVDNNPINITSTDVRVQQWSPQNRVSDVQHRQILDMNKDVIKKPTKSYTDEKKPRQTIKEKKPVKSIPQIKAPVDNTLEHKPNSLQTRRPIETTFSQSKRSLQLGACNTKEQMKIDARNSSTITKRLNLKSIQSYMVERQKNISDFLNKNLEQVKSGIQQRSNNISKISEEPQPGSLKKKMGKDAQKANNKYQQQMISMIQNMNKINGAQKSIDAEKTTDILYQKYGDNAYNLLLKAIQEPANYARITGDKNISTSRGAVQHLCNMKDTALTRNIVNKLLSR